MKRRIFIAINIPEKTRADIDAEVLKLEKLFKNKEIRFLRPETWHITLAFLGYKDDEALRKIVCAVKETADSVEPFWVKCDKLCYGPPGRRARMIWLKTNRESTNSLCLVKEKLDSVLLAYGIEAKDTKRQFEGHITLARFKSEPQSYPELTLRRTIEFEAQSLDIMESFLHRDGAVYECLGKAPFMK
jgi:2'-5' RNA ligase